MARTFKKPVRHELLPKSKRRQQARADRRTAKQYLFTAATAKGAGSWAHSSKSLH